MKFSFQSDLWSNLFEYTSFFLLMSFILKWISFSLQSVICVVCVCTENVWGGSQLLIKHHSQGHLKIPFTFFIELNKSDYHNCFHFIHFHLIFIHLYQLLSSIDIHFQARLTCFCPPLQIVSLLSFFHFTGVINSH